MTNCYITTPIYYPNGEPHIGTAFSTLYADVLARYHKSLGQNVKFHTGLDEHGSKVRQAAGDKPIQEHVDSLSDIYQHAWSLLDIQPTQFVRTSDPEHCTRVQKIFSTLQDKGFIYKGEYAGYYDVKDETFVRASEVVNGKTLEGNPVTWLVEPAYFFRLTAFHESLLKAPNIIFPDTKANEVKGFIDQGLQDICVSRTGESWGVKVPGDEEQTIYVWFDALLNYITFLGYPGDISEFWNENTIQVLGKDILSRFHGTLWLAILAALDLPWPKVLIAHGWFTVGGGKHGKSRSDSHLYKVTGLYNRLIELGVSEKFAGDVLRFYLIHNGPIVKDIEYDPEDILRDYNAHLVNTFSNSLYRVCKFTQKQGELKIVPTPNADALISAFNEEIKAHYDAFRPDIAIAKTLEIGYTLSQYLETRSPWTLTNASEIEQILNDAFRLIRCYIYWLQFVCPSISAAFDSSLRPNGDHWLIPEPEIHLPRIKL